MSDAYDDCECDFPYCKKDFEFGVSKKIAILKDSRALAFCTEHCKVLRNHGIKLHTLSEIHRELQEKEARIRGFLNFVGAEI
jgi:hypothetical protein